MSALDARDRTGLLPRRNFWLLLFALTWLAVGVPWMTATAAVPYVGVDPVTMFADAILPSVLFAAVLMAPIAAGMKRRRLWVIRYVFLIGAALLAGWLLATLFAIAGPAGLTRPAHASRDGSFMAGYALVVLLVLGVPAFGVGRALRDPYWQPWAPRDRWAPRG